MRKSQPKRVRGNLELGVICMLSAKADAMSKRLEQLNVNSISSSTPFPSCEIIGSASYLTVNCQVRSPFAQDASNQVNYVNTYNPRPTNNRFFNKYNPGWRNHPSFSDKSNVPPIPQMDVRPTLRFQRPSYPQ